jgi:hypothetical protein
MNKKMIFPALLLAVFMLSSVAVMVTASPVAVRKVTTSTSTEETTSTTVTATATGDGIVHKYALIIGISNYKAISDLSYCDEDASDWYNFLSPKGYVITLLGDGSSPYPRAPDGVASEYNTKNALAGILAVADADDIVVYASSGHGTEIKIGKGRTATYQQAICAWDCSSGENGQDGLIRDTEFQIMFATAVCNVFIFLDHCFSGGMNEVMSNTANIYMTTTCTADGYGYDVPTYLNGAWTYFFLEFSLIGHFGGNASMEVAFDYAAVNYPYDGGDMCMEFDKNTAIDFYL